MRLYEVQIREDSGPLGVGRYTRRADAVRHRDHLARMGWGARVVKVNI